MIAVSACPIVDILEMPTLLSLVAAFYLNDFIIWGAKEVVSGVEETGADHGVSCCLGVTAGIKPGLTVNGEFVSYLSEDDYSYSGFNFGLSKLF